MGNEEDEQQQPPHRSPPAHKVRDVDDYDGELLDGGGREQHEREELPERVDDN